MKQRIEEFLEKQQKGLDVLVRCTVILFIILAFFLGYGLSALSEEYGIPYYWEYYQTLEEDQPHELFRKH